MKRLAIIALLLSGPAWAHGEYDWIRTGNYVNPSAAGPAMGTHCCGAADCHPVEPERDFVADGEVWRFRPGLAADWAMKTWGMTLAGKTWPRDLSQTYRSEDSKSWVCVGPEWVGIRCFFFDFGGF